MKILAVDTSSRNCSVSIVEVDKNKNINVIAQGNNDDERTHSVKLMPMIDNMFKTSNLSLDNIDLLACCLGPGSFTGIRIGVGTVLAFKDSLNIPCIGISSLQALAYNINDNGIICSLIDAKNNNVYFGVFEKKNNIVTQLEEFSFKTIDEIIPILQKYNKIIFVGDGSTLYQNKIKSEVKYDNIIFADTAKNDANSVSIAISAYSKYKNGESGDTHVLSPLYLRKSQAERALEEKNIKDI